MHISRSNPMAINIEYPKDEMRMYNYAVIALTCDRPMPISVLQCVDMIPTIKIHSLKPKYEIWYAL